MTILDKCKIKGFTDDNLNIAKKIIYVLNRVENIVGKGGNAGYQHFLLSQQCFQKPSLSGPIKLDIVW